MFKFQDFDGKILALRAEITTPIARIVTSRMLDNPTPYRLFYISNVFRHSQPEVEKGREFWQAGVELIGCNTPEADGEILSLLVSSLQNIGLKDVRVDLGHMGFLKDLLKATGFDEMKKTQLRNFLAYRDEIRLEQFMEQNNLPSNLTTAFIKLSNCRKLNELSAISFDSGNYRKLNAHLKNLQVLNSTLCNYGIAHQVFFDFSLTRKIEYYTGIVFEASVPNLGIPLGGGGRYDNLIEKFGNLKLPATGFALEIEKCMQAMTAQGHQILEKDTLKILVSSKPMSAAVKVVNRLREAGVTTLVDIANQTKTRLTGYAELAGIEYIIYVPSNHKKPVTVYNVRAHSSKRMSISRFLNNLGEKIRIEEENADSYSK